MKSFSVNQTAFESTESQTRRFPELLTDDVNRRGGTVQVGDISNLFKVEVYMSAFMALTKGMGEKI